MKKEYKRSRTACAFVVAFSLITPSVNAASLPAPMSGIGVPTGTSLTIAGEQIFLAEHRRDRRARHNRDGRRVHRDRDRRRVHRDRDRRRLHRDRELRRIHRDRELRRIHRERDRRHVYRDHDRPRYRHGYRGSRDHRHGYRRDNDGWWYPLAAFAIGAAIIAQQNRNRTTSQTYSQTYSNWDHIPAGNMNAHDAWCDQRYRSYHRSSKTFQPYNGPRKYCNSPYDLL